ncbi:NAD(P)-dependent glycerol-3-phosphate dehydrogenase [Alphaproteobacteria bacterium KMM 3653]|uniref:Glycerol-3-phosphate dehydrogenase [NAD(P)+] n=1 Tax=Harenicola maris TaxID=2841044 RepID=A0AAP2G8Q3_9RHOB|nr:NAD(P)-dependent glycerol-3-phosphate dehydrogenase [Harenicola maris]
MTGVTILGGGAFGTALAVALAEVHSRVHLWARQMPQGREMPRLPGVILPQNVTVSPEIEVFGPILAALPMSQLEGVLRAHPALAAHPIVACCKGIRPDSGLGPAGVITSVFPESAPALLTGPSFAIDIARGLPTALTLACADPALGAMLQEQLSTPRLRLYLTTDVAGAELGGALKNVIAIACGIAMGAGFGESARAALMTRGFAEMTRFAVAHGALPETLAGLSGLGDLSLTSSSEKSRNFAYGLALGRGETPDSATTTEGIATARACAARARSAGIPLPVTEATAAVLAGEISPNQALTQLLSRPLTQE